uniref:Gem-associated protein 8 n=1 Tax=Timema shepardi TaxID=629360 RepID=A0A7R9AL94_TIMSH|nr:unnamed protein product [Timema shepardi]
MSMQEGNSNEVSSTSLNSLRQQQSYKKKKRKYNKKTSNLPELGRKPDVELSHPFGTVFNFDKFWKSYHNAFNWHRRHDVAYWKAQAAALGYENKVLHDYIRLLLSVTNQGPTYPLTGVLNPSQYVRPFQTPDTSTISLASSKKRRGRKRKNRNRKRKRKLSVKEEASEDSEIDEENLDFEVDEGMMEFLKKSLQFKLEQRTLGWHVPVRRYGASSCLIHQRSHDYCMSDYTGNKLVPYKSITELAVKEDILLLIRQNMLLCSMMKHRLTSSKLYLSTWTQTSQLGCLGEGGLSLVHDCRPSLLLSIFSFGATSQPSFTKSAVPLQEQVGLKRQQEAKAMYGESAPKLLAMETAMQLSFDRYCDKNQPQMWPVISLCF